MKLRSSDDSLNALLGDPAAHGDLEKRFADARAGQWRDLAVNLKTLTPIYGGSAKAGKPDLLMPFRPRAIRNGVAHWWWLLNRQQFRNPDDLWREYALTFGARAGAEHGGPSPFQVRVVKAPDPASIKCAIWWPYQYRQPNNDRPGKLVIDNGLMDLGYALFPARGQLAARHAAAAAGAIGGQLHAAGDAMPGLRRIAPHGEHPLPSSATQQLLNQLFADEGKVVPPSVLIEPGIEAGVRFSWRISLAARDEAADIRELRLLKALHLWLMLGGIGGRTSRGLGVFDVTGVSAGSRRDLVPGHLLGDPSTSAPLFTDDSGKQIAGFTLLRAPEPFVGRSPVIPWRKAVEEYRALRQVRLNRQTFSFFPDADSLRRVQDTYSEGHGPRHPASLSARIFADPGWGAPIVMKYKDDKKKPNEKVDPAQTQIGFDVQGKLARFPSPFRLRPVRLPTGEYSCLAFFSPSREDLRDKGLRMTWKGGSHTVAPEVWQGRDPTQPNSPFKALAQFTDVSVAQAYGTEPDALPVELKKFHQAVQDVKSLGAAALIRYLSLEKSRPGPGGSEFVSGGWRPAFVAPKQN